jgi:hypothetical protein
VKRLPPLLLALAAAGCLWRQERFEDDPSVPPATTVAAPSVDSIEVPDWPPLGPNGQVRATVSDRAGSLTQISARFRTTVRHPAQGARATATFTGSELGDGMGMLAIVAENRGGARAQREVSRFLVDLEPPELEPVRSGASPLLAGEGGELVFIVRDAWVLGRVELSVEGQTFVHQFPKGYPGTLGTTWDQSRVGFSVKGLPEGPRTASLLLVDAAGNSAGFEVPVTIDGTPPAARVLSPAEGSTVAGSFVVRVSGTDAGSIDPVQLQVFVGGTPVATLPGPTAELSVDSSTFSPGPVDISVVAVDRVGNTSPPYVTHVVLARP